MVAAALLIVAAAVLPAATSGARLAGVIAGYAESASNQPVRIANATWGWWRGLDLRGIQTQLDDGSKVTIDHVGVRTSLWDVLRGRDLRDIQVDGMSVDLAVGTAAGAESAPAVARGPAEIAPKAPAGGNGAVATRAAKLMTARKPGRASPVHSIPVNQILLSQCVANVRDVATGRTTRLVLPAGRIDLDRTTGAVNWRITARVDERGDLTTEGNFVLPRLAISPADLGGSLQVTWSDMPLADLPKDILRRVNLHRSTGAVTGGCGCG